MKATPALLFGCASAVSLLLAPLWGQQNSVPVESVKRLEASRSFDANSAPSPSSAPGYPQFDPSGNKVVEPTGTIDFNPFKSRVFDAPPPETKEEAPRPQRRVNPTNARNEKDDNWLLNGVEQQRKIMEEQEKALSKVPADETDLSSSSSSSSDRKESRDAKTGASKKAALNSGLGIYSRYTTSGLEALRQPTAAPYDPLAMRSYDSPSASEAAVNPLTAPEDGVQIPSPILDPLALAKAETGTTGTRSAPNSRLSVNEWLSSVKQRERLSLQPQQAPSIADLYDQNQIHVPAPVKLPTTPAPTLNRPKAENIRNPTPKRNTIADPNDF